MIGHLMSEEWLKPIRSEAEAAALTAALSSPSLALPLAFALDGLYPWAGEGAPALPPGRARFLDPPFFLARSASTSPSGSRSRSGSPARGTCAARARSGSRSRPHRDLRGERLDPLARAQWWSGLYGVSFAVSQLLAALAGAILISLLRPEHPGRHEDAEPGARSPDAGARRAVAWFAPFLIVWLGNLPHEAAWYLARTGPWLWPFLGIALPALVLAVLILVPPGFGRRTMIAGSALLLLHHGAHMLWLLGPARGTVRSMQAAF
jgi:hypothetical protein